ncbi:hypothetical protein T492DRAFT_895127 [Pavlovales sp. CCMP2436]|nr:hypothetical protein T492DRAFT_895127 [Pavlovales sp. CCMP2436]
MLHLFQAQTSRPSTIKTKKHPPLPPASTRTVDDGPYGLEASKEERHKKHDTLEKMTGQTPMQSFMSAVGKVNKGMRKARIRMIARVKMACGARDAQAAKDGDYQNVVTVARAESAANAKIAPREAQAAINDEHFQPVQDKMSALDLAVLKEQASVFDINGENSPAKALGINSERSPAEALGMYGERSPAQDPLAGPRDARAAERDGYELVVLSARADTAAVGWGRAR